VKLNHFYKSFKSKFCNITIFWYFTNTTPKITRIYLKEKSELSKLGILNNLKKYTCNMVDDLTSDMIEFFNGIAVKFNLDTIDINLCPDFQKQVLLAEYNIPRGYVSTYKRIATFLGYLKGSRAVGNALANNPFPLIIPCHRAVKSNGELGGYQGGIKMKKVLLQLEGIKFDEENRVISKNIYY
jgi:methylated-DNA-[protein]-cysteine S-methyltransferase